MTNDTVTVGGLPGTGTSTLCRLLQDRLDLPYVYAGEIFRQHASQRGMSLEAFGALCQKDPDVDRALDDEQVRLLKAGHILLEGRLAGWLAFREGIPSFRVWVTCEDAERMRRIAERDGGDVDEQRRATMAREASEADRYRRYYGIDLTDMRPYDLVLDSTRQDPETLADAVERGLRAI